MSVQQHAIPIWINMEGNTEVLERISERLSKDKR